MTKARETSPLFLDEGIMAGKIRGMWYGFAINGDGYAAGRCIADHAESATYHLQDNTKVEIADGMVCVGPEGEAVDVWFKLRRKQV